MNELYDLKKINVEIDKIENKLITENQISLSILRLDKIHSEISGNKLFKLYYFIESAIVNQKNIVTFGGAYSNHLAAAASICNLIKVRCFGIVNGEEPKVLSHTLLFCKEKRMQLEFISREKYRKKYDKDFLKKITAKFGEYVLIPEGGYSKEGVKGAALMQHFYSGLNFTHVCCPIGTATTLAGVIKSSLPSQKVIGFNSLKNKSDIESRLLFLLDSPEQQNYSLISDCHFGGFAKKTDELLLFMNKFYEEFAIPTDFVYTAKMMFAIFDLIRKNYFPQGSKILCIHTGGLQGNLSLPAGTLKF